MSRVSIWSRDYGQLVPKTTRTQDNSNPIQLVPGQLVSKTTGTQDNSYPGQRVLCWEDNGNQLINHIAKDHNNEDLREHFK